MYEVLRSKAARDDYEKCLNYLQILRRYLFFRDNERTTERETNREIDEIEETRAPLSEEAILSALAKIHAPKARRLLRHWKTNAPERLKWDNTGTVSIDGRVIPRTNITELLLDALQRKPKEDNEAPVGRYEFAQFLKASDTPSDLIGNPKVLKIGQILTAKRRVPSRQVDSSMSPIAS